MARSGFAGRQPVPTVALVAAGDKRFRRPDVRPAGRRRIGRWVWQVGRVMLAGALVAVVGYEAARVALSSRTLLINDVVVRGNVRLSRGEIDALVQGLRGQHVLRADLDAYRRRLMESPWISAAAMRRVLPGTVEIRVVERTPMAIARVGDRLFLVADEGIVVDEFGPQYRDVDRPIVDGLVQIRAGGPPIVDEARAALTRSFLDEVRGAALRAGVSQIDVSNERDVVVLLDGDPTAVHVGDAKFAERLRTYEALASTLQERLRDIDYVDMRFDTRVYVKSKGPHPPAELTGGTAGGM
jgi:cell division protein FtsQ